MSLKYLCIFINDILCYLLFIAVFIVSGLAMMAGNVGSGIIILVAGSVIASILSGFWMLLSSINDSSKAQVELLKQMLGENRG